MSNQVQVDVNVILQKLQTRLGEALATIAFLEAQIEAMQAAEEGGEAAPVAAAPEVITPEVVA